MPITRAHAHARARARAPAYAHAVCSLPAPRWPQPFGILPTLDDETIVGDRGSDESFMGKLRKNNKSNRIYQNDPKSKVHFYVNHYAGKVRYAGLGFLEKNRDTLTTDLMELLQSSSQPLVNELYPPHKTVSSKEKKASLSKQFQSQLNTLMRRLNKTQPHYIRCVKPNNDKRAKYFVPRNCFEQLTYSGVFEAVAIRKQGCVIELGGWLSLGLSLGDDDRGRVGCKARHGTAGQG